MATVDSTRTWLEMSVGAFKEPDVTITMFCSSFVLDNLIPDSLRSLDEGTSWGLNHGGSTNTPNGVTELAVETAKSGKLSLFRKGVGSVDILFALVPLLQL